MKATSFILTLVVLVAGCAKDDIAPVCGPEIQFLQGEEDFPPSDPFRVISLEATDNCLTVEVGASGCSTDGWTMDLYTSGIATTAIPSSTVASLIFDDGVPEGEASCLAYYTATYSFDLSDYLQTIRPSYLAIGGADTTLYIE